jgi:3-oxoacyl-[acyl-carrier protein] reductase
MKLNELRIVVTGAASGLGRQFCLSLAREGAQVAAVDIHEAGLGTLAAEPHGPGTIRTWRADVARQEEVQETIRQAVEHFGSLNGLINNAGVYRDGVLVKVDEERGRLLKLPLAQWQAVIDVDLTGPFLMTREVAAHMLQQKVRPGIIINISSVSRHGNAGQANYSAAKAGVVANTTVWAQELAPYGIRVGAIAPGFIRTPILRAMHPEVLEGWISRVPLKRLGEPEEIFAGVRFIIECEYFNARCLEIDGGLRMGT